MGRDRSHLTSDLARTLRLQTRRTRLNFLPRPTAIDGEHADFNIKLAPRENEQVYLTVSCQIEKQATPTTAPYHDAHQQLQRQHSHLVEHYTSIHTPNSRFESWLTRSSSDLLMMLTDTGLGLYPYAGIPWFSTIFGRDGLITALETLWIYPDIAKGVLRYLAATQAAEYDPTRDAEPGKILHEQREGEMANLREIPFGRYYGAVDATPRLSL